jgi:amino acid transporter
MSDRGDPSEVKNQNDLEKASVSETPSYRVNSARETNYEAITEEMPNGSWGRFVDTFRRDENQSVTPRGAIGSDGKVYDPKAVSLATATSPLQRNLKARHLQMIAIGGSIGEILLHVGDWHILNHPRNWSLHCLRQGSQ